MSRSLTRLTLAVGAPYLAALALVAFWPHSLVTAWE